MHPSLRKCVRAPYWAWLRAPAAARRVVVARARGGDSGPEWHCTPFKTGHYTPLKLSGGNRRNAAAAIGFHYRNAAAAAKAAFTAAAAAHPALTVSHVADTD